MYETIFRILVVFVALTSVISPIRNVTTKEKEEVNSSEILLYQTPIYEYPLLIKDYTHMLYLTQAIHGVPKIREGYNPATWMLEVTSPQAESQMELDYAKIYEKSELYQYESFYPKY